MPTFRKTKATLKTSKPKQATKPARIDWSKGNVTAGGGVTATIQALRRTRGKNKKPTKEQVAIRIDPEVLAAFRAEGPGWQTRMNDALKQWLLENR
jgi:uncharacterized protein (DUF4415 family)